MTRIGRAFPILRLRSILQEGYFRAREGERSNSRTRASQRIRRATLGGLMTAANSGVGILGSLIVMPLMLHSLGAERFGLWVTLTSLMALSALGDLGIGNGLTNAISTAHGTDDRSSALAYVSSAFFMALAFAGVLLALFAVLDFVVPWATVFNLSSPAAISEVGPAVKVVIACVVLNVPLGVVVKVRAGYQEVQVTMLWLMLGSIGAIVALVALAWLKASLPWLVFAVLGIPLIAMTGNVASLFLIERPWLRPSLKCVRLGDMRRLFQLGLLFLVLHLTYIVAYSSDNLLAIWICGPEAAGLYAIAMKLFAPCRLLTGTLLTPLWPAYGEAVARGDIGWARRAVAVSIIALEVLVVPLALVGLFFGSSLASLWFQRSISLGFGLLAGIALWVVLDTIGSGLAIFLNGASVIRAQVPLCITFAAAAIAAKVTLAHEFGIAGIIWGTVLPYALIQVLPYLHLIRRTFRDLDRQNAISVPSLRSPL